MRCIVGQPIPQIPVQLDVWMESHPGWDPGNGMVLTQKWARGPVGHQQLEVIYYHYRADRAKRSLHGIDEQVHKAQAAIEGRAPVKRNP